VTPFPLPEEARIVLERSLLTRGPIWAGVGFLSHLLARTPVKLIALARAEALDVVDAGG